jgi:hypothetical protein
MQIAYEGYMAQVSHEWGKITALAKVYKISRAFVYSLINTIKENLPKLFHPKEKVTKLSKKKIFSKMLSSRMEGRCSIEAISTIMKREEFSLNSVGMISQTLSSIGKLLPSSIESNATAPIKLMVASDEIFSKSAPILITVDPISSAILSIEKRDSRKGEDWREHYDELKKSGFVITGIVRDEGNGLGLGAKESLPDATYQVDAYHAIAHRLGLLVEKFDKQAYRIIDVEAQSKDKKQHQKKLEDSIELSDNFRYLYHSIVHQLKPFTHTGKVRDKQIAKEEIETALELMETLNATTITTEIKTIRKILPNLLNYFDQTKEVIKESTQYSITKYQLENLCLEWQWEKALIKAKVQSRRNKAREQKKFYQAFNQELLQERYKIMKETIFKKLETIIQASSMVETINSILRPYLNNSKNQVTQNFLNLFMFYHNHRRYRAGKRKGKTPLELLTNTEQKEDWIELLTQKIESKDKDFFL